MLQIDGNFFVCKHFDTHNIVILGNNILVSIKEKLHEFRQCCSTGVKV